MARRTPLGLQHVTRPKRANNRAWKQQITLARIEDLAFMADTERREKALRCGRGDTLESLDKWAREARG